MRVILATVFATLFALEPNAAANTQDLGAQVQGALEDQSRRTGRLVDPRIIDEIVHDLRKFSGNFCVPVGDATADGRCAATIGDRGVLGKHLSAFVADAMHSDRTRIETVGSRLARHLGLSYSQIGWPSDQTNPYGVVVVSPALSGAHVALSYADSQVSLGRAGTRVLIEPGSSVLILTQTDGNKATYRVNVSPRSQVALSGPSTASLSGRIQPSTKTQCSVPSSVKYEGPTAFFNWGRVSFGEDEPTRERHRAPFTKQYGIDIRVTNSVGTGCGANCERSIAIGFVEAIAIWRTGCQRCDRNALSVVRIGDSVWLDQQLSALLRQRTENAISDGELDLGGPLEINPRAPNRGSVETARALIMLPQSSITGYEPLSDDADLLRKVCSLPVASGPWVRSARQLACGQNSGLDAAAFAPVIQLKSTPTTCGPAADFLACGMPGQGIEITFDQTKYILHSQSGPEFVGDASQPEAEALELKSVILHEVGHWFGIPHPEDVQIAERDIMSGTYGAGPKCMGWASGIMMNNAADLRWTYRIKNQSGLRRPPRGSAPTPAQPQIAPPPPSSNR